MLTRDFSFDLPPELIAQHPPAERSGARLLTLDGRDGRIGDARIVDLPDLLHPGDLLVFNDTRVIPARLFGQKDSGGQVEVLVERILDPHRVLAHLRCNRSPGPGTRLELAQVLRAEVQGRDGDLFELRFEQEVLPALERHGHVPLPPYIQRADQPEDRQRYQTVYARQPGSVAAPTAGLHFDPPLLARLAQAGVETAFVTLHVGAGTFQPVRAQRVQEHHMHGELVEVPGAAAAQIRQTRQRGGRVVAVGTTAVRSLESVAAANDGELTAWQGETRLFIYPGYRYRVVDALITNFHLPESSLLMLVSAFAGYRPTMAAYRHAVAERYRFFSYGDAMLISRNPDPDLPPSAA